jgi:hypothetical protein
MDAPGLLSEANPVRVTYDVVGEELYAGPRKCQGCWPTPATACKRTCT